MKDFSKCGLTCPKWILEETLLQVQSRLDFNIITDLYNKINVYDDKLKENFELKRGYILGMANFLFTLI
jgi:hypothetical protein